ncbi:unnamed protein product [Durusdinium trenchii]|uniref:Uncharacterized protein n=1 Tax=Durusdinium trenchii TaxID=1381693 RepID=A0ABP0IFI0_9DINO
MGHEDSSSDESDALRDDQHLPFAAAFKKTKSLRSVPWLGLFSQSILLQWRGVVFCDLIPNSGTPAPDTPFCLRFGLTLVVGHSGKVNKKGKVPTIKDLLANQEVLLAVVKGTEGRPHISAGVLKRAILAFYSSCSLFPLGLVAELPAVDQWAEKSAKALKRLASRLRRLMKRSHTAKSKAFSSMKQRARECGWDTLRNTSKDPESCPMGFYSSWRWFQSLGSKV